MFTINDFWKIFELLKSGTPNDLSSVTQALAQSEQVKTDNLFANVIDQLSFNTDDYNRLRQFLIDWYASHKSITSAQTQISDPFSIPDEHLDELFRSFGFNHSTKFLPTFENININKVNFFLDLVNLYKIKGTPSGLLRVLQYFGLAKIDILEYWLQKDSHGDLVFKSSIAASGTGVKTSLEIPFDKLTSNDPHWLQTKEQILQLSQNQKINFPSKSPYFEIRASYGGEPAQNILSRIIQDQHDEYESTGSISDQNATITLVNSTTSILELYLASIYIFNENFDAGTDNSPFICYDGTSTIYTDIISEYNTLISDPPTRAIRENRLQQYYDNFTRAQSTNFLENKDSAKNELILINPTLKNQLDILLQDKSVKDILISLLLDISNWSAEYITTESLNLVYAIYGALGIKYKFNDIINFFKPYHARLISNEIVTFQENRLFDSVKIADSFSIGNIEFTFDDWVTANSIPCCNDSTSCGWYSRETYDCGSYYDIGAAIDKNDFEIYIENQFQDTMSCIPNDSTSIIDNVVYDSTSDIDIITQMKESAGISESTNISEVHLQTSGFLNFDDSDGIFDCTHDFDVCQIFVEEI